MSQCSRQSVAEGSVVIWQSPLFDDRPHTPRAVRDNPPVSFEVLLPLAIAEIWLPHLAERLWLTRGFGTAKPSIH